MTCCLPAATVLYRLRFYLRRHTGAAVPYLLCARRILPDDSGRFILLFTTLSSYRLFCALFLFGSPLRVLWFCRFTCTTYDVTALPAPLHGLFPFSLLILVV